MLFPCHLEFHLPQASFVNYAAIPSARLLLYLDRAIREWLGVTPYLICEDGHMEFIYQNVIFPTSECGERFGGFVASIQPVWPVTLYGVAESDELVCLDLTWEADGGLLLCQENISGIPALQLRDLCLSVQLPDQATADGMAAILQASWACLPCAALDWIYADFIRRQGLGDTEPVNAFCYVFLRESVSLEERLLALSYPQKLELWRRFLMEGAEPLEFEWMADLLRRGKTPGRWLEWSLTLHQVLRGLGYQIQMGERRFSLLDCHGKRVYYGSDNTRAAERLLMKVLFPIRD